MIIILLLDRIKFNFMRKKKGGWLERDEHRPISGPYRNCVVSRELIQRDKHPDSGRDVYEVESGRGGGINPMASGVIRRRNEVLGRPQ